MRALLLAGLSVACAADDLPAADPAMVDAVIAEHDRVYEVFALGPDEDALHALLAEIYAGEALTEAYVAHYRTLVTLEAQDIEVRVLGVDPVEAEAQWTEAGLRVDRTWLVRSAIRHQAHTHARIARYRGFVVAVQTPEGPRIVSEGLADLRRVRSELDATEVFDEVSGPASARGFVDPLELLEAEAMGDGEGP